MTTINQQEIADRLGLSRTTVSRCFTNHPKINPETRARVMQLASQLGYQYSAPRNGVMRHQEERNVIATLVAIPARQIAKVDTAADILAGVSERIAQENMELEVHYVDPATFEPSPRPRRIIPNVNSARWRGLLLLYPFPVDSVRRIQHKFPVLSIMDSYDELNMDCVDTDLVHGIRKMVDHLYQLGHREFGFLSWKYRVQADWVERRLSAFIESMIHYDLPFDRNRLLNVGPREEVPLQRLAEMVAERVGQGVTAWICAADHQAYDLYQRLKGLGISVPGDCSITGFDGVEPPRGYPRVTSIGIPFREIGFSAAHSLLRKMGNPVAKRRHILVTGEVIPGETSGEVPAAWRTQY